jgi:hypothetical protein
MQRANFYPWSLYTQRIPLPVSSPTSTQRDRRIGNRTLKELRTRGTRIKLIISFRRHYQNTLDISHELTMIQSLLKIRHGPPSLTFVRHMLCAITCEGYDFLRSCLGVTGWNLGNRELLPSDIQHCETRHRPLLSECGGGPGLSECEETPL